MTTLCVGQTLTLVSPTGEAVAVAVRRVDRCSGRRPRVALAVNGLPAGWTQVRPPRLPANPPLETPPNGG